LSLRPWRAETTVQRRKRILLAASIAVAWLAVVSPAAVADPALKSVDRLSISTTMAGQRATVDVIFNAPVDQRLAAEIRDNLSAQPLIHPELRTPTREGDQQGAVPAVKMSAPDPLVPYVERLPCQTHKVRLDDNGTINLQYSCYPTKAAIAWSYNLSGTAQTTVVGPINERGMEWWQNSTFRNRGKPHVVPPDYLLHGTIVPVWNGDIIDYQDVISWQHNIGPGGKIVIVFAGSVQLG
jgi:hypothetical protein